MTAKKIWQLLKTVGESFSIGAGAIGILFSIIAAFVSIPLFISLPITGVIGLIFAITGTCYTLYELNKKERQNAMKKQSQQKLHDGEKELVSLAREMEHDLKTIKNNLGKHHHQLTKETKPGSVGTASIFRAVHPNKTIHNKNDSIFSETKQQNRRVYFK